MKTKSRIGFLALLAVVSLLTFSCSTDDTLEYPVMATETLKVGTITDLGPVSGDIRKMEINLGNQGNLIDGTTGEMTGNGIELNVSILTDQDHHLPSGTYSFPVVAGTFPFDIENGDAFVRLLNEEQGSVRYRVVSGILTVLNDGNEYVINFDFKLDSGDTFTGSVKGALSYEDVHD
ncbi:MAG TPA: hypothetical protein PKJ24_03185 [Prolixibacteraceae bacterium]|nr:hypothetical protein [Prolixibacteraceae bacterium]